MRRILLVAVREFMENVRTKGFWLGVIVLPIMLVAAFEIPVILEERGSPTRYFILADRDGSFESVVDESLDRLQQWRLLQSLNEYASEWVDKDKMKMPVEAVDLEKVPASAMDPQHLLEEFDQDNPGALDSFIEWGGKNFFLGRIQNSLLDGAPPFEDPKRLYVRLDPPMPIAEELTNAQVIESLKPWLLGEKDYVHHAEMVSVFAVILIPKDIENFIHRPGEGSGAPWPREGAIEFWSANVADSGLISEIERGINQELRRREFIGKGMDVNTVQRILSTRAEFRTLDPTKAAGQEEVSVADVIRQWAPSGFVYLLWLSIFMVAQMLLNNTIEEKSNRIIEVLLSSVTPNELMMGKLLGILGVGLTMLTIWLTTLMLMIQFRTGAQAEWARELLNVIRSSELLPWFVLYFFLGYLMYAGFFLSIGSVCNTLKEAQNFMLPLTLILMVPLFTMTFIPKDPNGSIATILSWIPFYSPFVMMNRAAADPPLFDRIGTLIMMIITTILVLAMSGRVFRTGILRTGQPPKLLEMLNWLWPRNRG